MKNKKPKPVKLTPPDPERCQCEQLEGSFMTLGPRSYRRCESFPVYLATEKNPNPKDGQVGAMTLCRDCAAVMLDMHGPDFATLTVL